MPNNNDENLKQELKALKDSVINKRGLFVGMKNIGDAVADAEDWKPSAEALLKEYDLLASETLTKIEAIESKIA